MTSDFSSSDLWSLFSELKDPRVDRNKQHVLLDILVLSLCGVLCGADGFAGIEAFGVEKEAWFRTFLMLPNGIPSHDTLGRVFAMLEPKAFAACLTQFIEALDSRSDRPKTIAIDGKTLRKSFDKAAKKSALHLLSAWSTETGLLLGQEKTKEKSNEITAIPILLQRLDLKGAIITIDAMGCQTEIAEQIKDQEGDYVLCLKENQGTLRKDVELFFQDEDCLKAAEAKTKKTVDKDHGRVETRTATTIDKIDWLDEAHKLRWPGLKSITRVLRIRDLGEKVEQETSYYLSSLVETPARFLQIIRGHWSIENSLHWVMDVVFAEDDSRIRKDHAAENMATLRRMSLTLLKQETTAKVGLAIRRLKAGWSTTYLLKLLRI